MSDLLDQVMRIMECAFDPAFGEAWTRGQVESALAMGNCRLVVLGSSGREPVAGEAAAAFSLVRSIAGEDELLLFAVAPDHRRRGLGTQLLDRVLEDCRRRQSSRIHLEMRRGNPAEQLYRARGFVPVGVRPNYYVALGGDRLDAITFCYEL